MEVGDYVVLNAGVGQVLVVLEDDLGEPGQQLLFNLYVDLFLDAQWAP